MSIVFNFFKKKILKHPFSVEEISFVYSKKRAKGIKQTKKVFENASSIEPKKSVHCSISAFNTVKTGTADLPYSDQIPY